MWLPAVRPPDCPTVAALTPATRATRTFSWVVSRTISSIMAGCARAVPSAADPSSRPCLAPQNVLANGLPFADTPSSPIGRFSRPAADPKRRRARSIQRAAKVRLSGEPLQLVLLFRAQPRFWRSPYHGASGLREISLAPVQIRLTNRSCRNCPEAASKKLLTHYS
jgi:hypothetical protein